MANRPCQCYSFTNTFYKSYIRTVLILKSGLAIFALGIVTLSTFVWAGGQESPSLLGPLGLNTIPSARMEPAGTIRAGVSTLDPYAHATLAVQTNDSLNITLRQSAETSALNDDADRLYPGVDLKLRLAKETKFTPEFSLGAIGSLGHKRMAGEYLALSKRYHDFDFTAGLGWGRYGSSGTFDNPFGVLGRHFDDPRALDGEMPNGPEDWLTGEDTGLFGGVEYFTPINGLSLKLDWGADRFIAEETAFDFDAPDPWSIGLHYAPTAWANLGIGVMGGDKILAALSLKSLIAKWPGRNRKPEHPVTLRPHRTDMAIPAAMAQDAARDGDMILHTIRRNLTSVWARLDADPDEPMPRQIGAAARHMANHAGLDAEEILITPEIYGLNGPTMRLMRRDLEQAAIHHQGSPQEIWRNALLTTTVPDDLKNGVAETRFHRNAASYPVPKFRFILDTQASLSEEDHGLLYRTSGLVEMVDRMIRPILVGLCIRFNGPHNLDDLDNIRPVSIFPVRGDAARFAGKTVTIDRMYSAWTRSSGTGNWHAMAATGYLEEMYAGLGGEILYRPYGKTYAFGMELWEALKRDPGSAWSLAPNGDHLLTGHVKAWYEIPQTDLTLGLKIGRYLAEDIGATLTLSQFMENGARIDAFATATDNADFDLWGGTTHLYSGLRLTLPLGNFPFLPSGSQARVSAAPLGRDYGQSLDSPIPLYETTEPLSYRHMAQHWTKVTE